MFIALVPIPDSNFLDVDLTLDQIAVLQNTLFYQDSIPPLNLVGHAFFSLKQSSKLVRMAIDLNNLLLVPILLIAGNLRRITPKLLLMT